MFKKHIQSKSYSCKILYVRYLATIHRAAYRYHFLDIGGLKRPGVWTNLKICYRDEYNSDHSGINWGTNWPYFSLTALGYIFGGVAGSAAGAIAAGLIPNIVLYGKNSTGGYRPTNELFSITIHELAHASHINLFTLDELQYGQVSKLLRESWPVAVAWHISRIEYVFYLHHTQFDNPALSLYYNGNHYQNRTNTGDHDYTPLFVDMVDDFNQSIEYSIHPGIRPNDNVTGYTMQNLENMLKTSYGLSSLSVNLYASRPSYVTQSQLDTYLNFYYTW